VAHIAAIGEPARLQGLALAGVTLYPAPDPESVRTAWTELPPDTAVVVLTSAAAEALPDAAGGPLPVVMPR
jgi:vacuolar-type H+-ATPase subunit F/Vma7